MSQNYTYPPGFATSVNPSVGVNGAVSPASSTQVGGVNPSGNLEPLNLDSSGNLKVDVQSSAGSPVNTQDAADGPVTPGAVASKSILIGGQYNSSFPTLTNTEQSAIQVDSSARVVLSPLNSSSTVTVVQPTGTNLHAVIDSGSITISGTVTANQGAANATPWNENISEFGGSSVTLGQKVSASSIPVVVSSDQSSIPISQSGTWNINNISGTISLPTGASTSANQTTANSSLSTIATNTTGLNSTIAATSSAVPADAIQIGVKNGSNLVPITEGQALSANSLPVVLASDQSAIPIQGEAGRSFANAPVYNVYSSVNITTSAYVELVSSTSSKTNYIDIFDSSGQAMILAVGAVGLEVVQAYIPPGGDQIPLMIPAGSRVAYKALTATANSGYLLMNFYT